MFIVADLVSWTYVLGAQKNSLIETVLLSTHNICFVWEIRKLNFRYALLTKVLGKKELVALLLLSSLSLVTAVVLWLFLTVPRVGLQCVIVVFPDHTHFFNWFRVCKLIISKGNVFHGLNRLQCSTRALTRILKTGVQDSHLAKSRSPTGKSGSPTPKKLESHQFVHTVYLFHFSRKRYIWITFRSTDFNPLIINGLFLLNKTKYFGIFFR